MNKIDKYYTHGICAEKKINIKPVKECLLSVNKIDTFLRLLLLLSETPKFTTFADYCVLVCVLTAPVIDFRYQPKVLAQPVVVTRVVVVVVAVIHKVDSPSRKCVKITLHGVVTALEQGSLPF